MDQRCCHSGRIKSGNLNYGQPAKWKDPGLKPKLPVHNFLQIQIDFSEKQAII